MSEGHVWSSADKLVGVHQTFPQKSWRDSAGGISVFFCGLKGDLSNKNWYPIASMDEKSWWGQSYLEETKQ